MTQSKFNGYAVSADLEPRINELGLERNVRDLVDHGYTVFRDPQALAIADRLRQAIIRDTPTQDEDNLGSSLNLLDQDSVYAEAIAVPSLLCLVEFLLGKGALLSQVNGSRVRKGPYTIGLHADNGWFPEPFPQWEINCTACFVTDEYTKEGGATLVIPGTHKHKRQPSLEEKEALEGAIPITAPKGSICLWDGSVWHSNYPRQIPGERVVLHMTYARVGIAPIESYDYLGDDWFEGKDPALLTLLGRRNFLGRRPGWKEDHEERFLETFAMVHGKDHPQLINR